MAIDHRTVFGSRSARCGIAVRGRFAVWLALCSIVFAALAPTLSHALTASQNPGGLWTEICSAAGSKIVVLADSGVPQKPDPGSPAAHLEHCPFCSIHAPVLALPAQTSLSVPALEGSDTPPLLFYRAPRPLFAWASAQPRAPPALF